MAHEVDLTWAADPDAASYDVYRGSASGKEGASPVATGITGTTWTDKNVVPGQTYFYTVTAVNGSAQSSPSNEASATVPFAPPSGLTAVAS
jgi:fibronectin type 3 domain-containing protein